MSGLRVAAVRRVLPRPGLSPRARVRHHQAEGQAHQARLPPPLEEVPRLRERRRHETHAPQDHRPRQVRQGHGHGGAPRLPGAGMVRGSYVQLCLDVILTIASELFITIFSVVPKIPPKLSCKMISTKITTV